jgi:hypothetical protein
VFLCNLPVSSTLYSIAKDPSPKHSRVVDKISAKNGLGVCYGNQNKYEDALGLFDEIIQSTPFQKSCIIFTRSK